MMTDMKKVLMKGLRGGSDKKEDTQSEDSSENQKHSSKKGKSKNILPDDKSKPKLTSAAKSWFKSIFKKGVRGVVAEFGDIKNYVPDNYSTVAYEGHPKKNRYKDVLCLDQTRVKLDDLNCDYIHASYVDGQRPRQFICTQGALDRTASDFWEMVWQERSAVVVMLCKCVERDVDKCAEYWPVKLGKKMVFGDLRIKNMLVEKVEGNSNIVATRLKMRRTNDKSDVHFVIHYQWGEWPDTGVPTNFRGVIELIKRITGYVDPVVIHCSAGIGRTGSVVAIDISLSKLKSNLALDVSHVVRRIRDQRLHSVQNAKQYLLIHRVLLEYFIEQVPSDLTPMQQFCVDYDNVNGNRKQA